MSEIVQVVCPRISKHLTNSINLKEGIFSKQSPPSLFGQVLIQFIDSKPSRIMCPRYRPEEENVCGGTWWGGHKDCTDEKWIPLRDSTEEAIL